MERFTALYLRLDQSNRTSEKIEALKDYFRTAPPADAAWALYLFTGRKIGRTMPFPQLRRLAVEVTGYPQWLVDECNLVAGDFSETLALLLPPPEGDVHPEPLHKVIDELQSLGHLPAGKQEQVLRGMWKRMNADQRFVLHKLVTGNFRVGISEQLAIRALAEAAGVDPAIMAHRVAGKWTPSAAAMEKFMAPEQQDEAQAHDPSRPYPFMLAHALAEPLETLGPVDQWLLECKWDGIRAQVIRRAGKTFLWSRGDQAVATGFPDLLQAAADLPEGTVLDGEIVAWKEADDGTLGAAMPFAQLQTRINRKYVQVGFWPEVPIRYLTFDVLEYAGKDVRGEPLAARREMLSALLHQREGLIHLSQALPCDTWESVRQWLEAAREAGVEGVMLKQKTSAYVPGRPRGPWWKLKVQPFSVDAVLIAAQPGHGRRAGLLTDYTFGVWEGGELVPIAKAYSGLTDEELVEMDRFIRAKSTDRYGPVYAVPPVRVFEIAFEAIQKSDRHKSGIAVRFPRIVRARPDKNAAEADTLEMLRDLLRKRQALAK